MAWGTSRRETIATIEIFFSPRSRKQSKHDYLRSISQQHEKNAIKVTNDFHKIRDIISCITVVKCDLVRGGGHAQLEVWRGCWPSTGMVKQPSRTSVDHLFAVGGLNQHQLHCQQTHPPDEGFGGQTGRPRPSPMRILLAALLSLTALVVVVATGSGAKGSESFTTHIGSRVPPAEAGCFKTGQYRTDEDKLLNVFQCPA